MREDLGDARWLGRLGRWSARHAGWVLGGWVVAAVALVLLAPPLARVGVQDDTAFLPATAPSVEAQQVLARHFPQVPGATSVVVVLTSARRFDLADLAFVGRLDGVLHRGALDRGVTSVASPLATPAFDDALVAPDHRTALVVAATRIQPFTPAGDRLAAELHRFAGRWAPPGLHVAVTGSIGLGADEAQALVTSFDRTALVAAALVLAVMLLAYRSPVALVVPLASVGVAIGVAQGLVALLAEAGLAVSTMAGTFLVVVVFGAGTDYCLFLVSRHRSELVRGRSVLDAVAVSASSAGRVVATSAAVVTLSFLALLFARFGLYRTMGPALAVAVAVTAAAALTFTPAAIALLGEHLLGRHRVDRVGADRDSADRAGVDRGWVGRDSVDWAWVGRDGPDWAVVDRGWVDGDRQDRSRDGGRGRWWGWLADQVRRRPVAVATVGVAVLLGAAAGAVGIHQSFDLLDEIPPGASARVGYAQVAAAFGPSTTAPTELVLAAPRPLTTPTGRQAIDHVVATVAAVPGVVSVRSPLAVGATGPVLASGGGRAAAPTGAARAAQVPGPGRAAVPSGDPAHSGTAAHSGAASSGAEPARAPLTEPLLAEGGRLALLQVGFRGDPFGTRAQAAVVSVRRAANQALAASGVPDGRALVAGPTAQFADIAALARGDLVRIVAAVLLVLTVVLVLTFDSVVAPLVLVGSLLLSYGAALGLTTALFEHLLGRPDLSFWVPPFLFVMLVALGADYTMLVTSAVQEHTRAGATHRAAAAAGLVQTAPVVSAAGLVLAGSFLALLAAPMPTLEQLGFAVGVGVLADTFLVRPLVVPALLAALGDVAWWRPWGRRRRASDGR
jgi:RND superfamily putative drug exporter